MTSFFKHWWASAGLKRDSTESLPIYHHHHLIQPTRLSRVSPPFYYTTSDLDLLSSSTVAVA